MCGRSARAYPYCLLVYLASCRGTDLIFDAGEHNNLAHDPGHAEVLTQMQTLLKKWIERTNDPLPKGSIPLPPGGLTADVNAESPKHIKGLDGSQFK